MEEYLEQSFVDGFGDEVDMDQIISIIQKRKEQVSEDVWDIIASITDFTEFKQVMLEQKQRKNGTTKIDLSDLLIIKHEHQPNKEIQQQQLLEETINESHQ